MNRPHHIDFVFPIRSTRSTLPISLSHLPIPIPIPIPLLRALIFRLLAPLLSNLPPYL